MAQVDTSYEAAKPWMRGFAYRVLRRVAAAGAKSVLMEDIEQELAIAWLHAQRAWNPEAGVPFYAYLNRGMRQHINRWIERMLPDTQHCSLDLETEAGEVHEIVADAAPDPEEIVGGLQHRARVIACLSPRARLFVELLENPPQELVDATRALKAKSTWARERGLAPFIVPRVNAPLVFEVMGAGRAECARIRKEIQAAIEKASHP